MTTDNTIRPFFERIQRLEEERKSISDDIRDAFAEAKSNGHDTKAMRRAYALWKMKAEERAKLELYLDQLEIFG